MTALDRRTLKLVLDLIEKTSRWVGDDYFRSLAEHLGSTFQVRFAFISELRDSTQRRLRTLAICEDGECIPNLEYDTEHTPCEKVLRDGPASYRSAVQDSFPNDTWLVEAQLESYLAVPLYDSRKRPIGHLGLAHDEPLPEDSPIEVLLGLCAGRAGAELERRQAEAALRSSNERNETLVETIPHGIDDIDVTGKILYANSALHQLYGYEQGQLIGKSILDFVATAAERESLREWLATIANEQAPATPYFGRKRARDGRVRDCKVAWDYKRDADGNLVGFTSVITDITDRKRAEEALRTAHDELEARVEQRTAELEGANKRLREQVVQRKAMQKALESSETELLAQKRSLEEKNIALREVLSQIELDKDAIKRDVAANVERVLIPSLERMRVKGVNERQVALHRRNLATLTSSFGSTVTNTEAKLSPREIEICDMIRGGLSTKEIADQLGLSVHTVEKHRRNVRRKLSLTNQGTNLSSFLARLSDS